MGQEMDTFTTYYIKDYNETKDRCANKALWDNEFIYATQIS